MTKKQQGMPEASWLLLPYSASRAASRRPGAVVRVIEVLFDSMSAAHSAAPTALVNEKKIPAKGIISRRVATVPKL